MCRRRLTSRRIKKQMSGRIIRCGSCPNSRVSVHLGEQQLARATTGQLATCAWCQHARQLVIRGFGHYDSCAFRGSSYKPAILSQPEMKNYCSGGESPTPLPEYDDVAKIRDVAGSLTPKYMYISSARTARLRKYRLEMQRPLY